MGKVRGSCGLEHYDSRPHPLFSQGSSASADTSFRGHYQLQASGGHSSFHPRLAGKGDRQGDFSPLSSIFLQDVFGSEKERNSEAYNRSQKPQQNAYDSKIQNGEYREDFSGHSRVFVGFVSRYHGRLPSCSVTLGFPQIFCFCAGEEGVRLPEAPLRTVNSSLGIHKGHETHKKPSSLSRGDGLQLSGRLFNSSQFSSSPGSSHESSDLSVAGAGLFHKLGKVSSNSSKEVGIPGCDDGSPSSFSLSSSGQNLNDFGPLQGNVGKIDGFEERVGKPGRSSQFCGVLPPSGKALSASRHQVGESSHFRDHSGRSDSSDSAIWGASRSLAKAGVPESSCSYVLSSSISGSNDGRFPLRVERSSVTSQGGGSLGRGGGPVLNELEGIEGCSSNPSPFRRSDPGESGPGSVGQHDRFGVPEAAGLSEVGPSLESLEGDFGVVSGAESPGGSGSSQGDPECPGRCGFPLLPGGDGMDLGQGDVPLDLLPSRCSSGGSFCHQGQLPGEDVCVSLPGSPGSSSGRLLPGLGSLGSDLPLPSSGVHSGSGGEIGPVQGSGNSGGSFLESV